MLSYYIIMYLIYIYIIEKERVDVFVMWDETVLRKGPQASGPLALLQAPSHMAGCGCQMQRPGRTPNRLLLEMSLSAQVCSLTVLWFDALLQ